MLKTLTTTAYWSVIMLVAGITGNLLTERYSEWRRDTRTAAETEVHHVLDNPYIHLGDHQPNNQVRQGQVFYVNNKYIKSATCHVLITNLLVNKTTRLAHHYSMFTNWFKAGTYEFNEYFVMPEQIPPGHYNLIKKTTSFCNGREHYSINFDLELDVLPKI